MKPLQALAMCFLLLASPSCGGGSDSDDDYDSSTYMGGIWRGNLVLQRNDCNLALQQSFNFVHLVSQLDESVDLTDEQDFHFSGRITGADGFSVDALGTQNDRLPDGRMCDFTYRYRYDSVNDDEDRTAQVRFFYEGDCSDGTQCESEYAGDGMRD